MKKIILCTVVLALSGCVSLEGISKHVQTVDGVTKKYKKLSLPQSVNRADARLIGQRYYIQNKFEYKSYYYSLVPAPRVYLPEEYFNRKNVVRKYGLDQYDIREGFEYRQFPESFVVAFEDYHKHGIDDYIVLVHKPTGQILDAYSCAYTIWTDKYRCDKQ